MRLSKFTLDLWQFIFIPACLLLMFGAIPFTPVTVGALLIATKVAFTINWER